MFCTCFVYSDGLFAGIQKAATTGSPSSHDVHVLCSQVLELFIGACMFLFYFNVLSLSLFNSNTYLQKIDVMKLSVLSSKIAQAEKKASEQYIKLLSNHPKNVR